MEQAKGVRKALGQLLEVITGTVSYAEPINGGNALCIVLQKNQEEIRWENHSHYSTHIRGGDFLRGFCKPKTDSENYRKLRAYEIIGPNSQVIFRDIDLSYEWIEGETS